MSLISHPCKTRRLDFAELSRVPVPPSTATFVPIAHADLVAGARDSLSRAHLVVEDEEYAVNPTGEVFFGTLTCRSTIGIGDDLTSRSRLTIGLRNSHNHEFAAGLAVGFRVMVCDNRCFWGDRTLSRKHTLFIRRDLPRLLNAAVDEFVLPALKSLPLTMGTLAETPLSDGEYASIVLRLMRAGLLSAAELQKVDIEYNRADGPGGVFPNEPPSAWRLLNAITEVHKTSRAHPNTLATRSQSILSRLLPSPN